VSHEDLKEVVHRNISPTNKLLACLAVDGPKAKSVKNITDTALDCGLRQVHKWNVSQLLARAKGMAIRTPQGWELTAAGRREVLEDCSGFETPASKLLPQLRQQTTRIKNDQTRAFINEAISCLERDFHRAAIVLTWIGAVSILYHHVVAHSLTAFNAEASRRNVKWKPALTPDDLARMKEIDFLDTLEAISLLGKSVKKQLVHALDLRNACGHPNSFELSGHAAAAHVEVLTLNVFSKF
jgi:hypothetical protein